MDRIEQQGANDCGIASMAMYLGRSYQSVRDDFPTFSESRGLYLAHIEAYLKEKGHLVKEWILRDCQPLPRAKAILEVRVNGRGHFIVMDANGNTIDPSPAMADQAPRVEGYEVWRALYVPADKVS